MSHFSTRLTAGLGLVAGLVFIVPAQTAEPGAQDPLDRKVQELLEEWRNLPPERLQSARRTPVQLTRPGDGAQQAVEERYGATRPGEPAAVQRLRDDSRKVSGAAHQAAVHARNDGAPAVSTLPGDSAGPEDPKVVGGPAAIGPGGRGR